MEESDAVDDVATVEDNEVVDAALAVVGGAVVIEVVVVVTVVNGAVDVVEASEDEVDGVGVVDVVKEDDAEVDVS